MANSIGFCGFIIAIIQLAKCLVMDLLIPDILT